MTLDMIRLEIEKRQGRIQSLNSKLSRLRVELDNIYDAEDRVGERLAGSYTIPEDMSRIEREISSLESEIEQFMKQAREIQANEAPKHEFNPLEMLGISALMKADGKLSDEQFNAVLEEVRIAFKKD